MFDSTEGVDDEDDINIRKHRWFCLVSDFSLPRTLATQNHSAAFEFNEDLASYIHYDILHFALQLTKTHHNEGIAVQTIPIKKTKKYFIRLYYT